VTSTRFFAFFIRMLIAILLIAAPYGAADAQDVPSTQVVGVCGGDDGESPDGVALQTVAIHRTAERQDRDLDPLVGPAAQVEFGSRIPVTSRVGAPVTRRSSAPPTGPPLA
jgi:hypothetical protein